MAAVVASTALAGCDVGGGEKGSGRAATARRSVAPFRAVKLDGAVDVVAHVGGRQSVTVTGDDNLLDRVTTSVDGGTLEVKVDGEFSTPKGLTVVVGVPMLERFENGASGDGRVDGVRGERFESESSGSGDIRAAGRVHSARVAISGSGDADFGALVADDVRVEVEGSGDAHVHAVRSLDASVAGSGDVTYAGNPPHVDQHVDGSGDVASE
jgi:Putative auto-transporter adhesin, head GIN domain